MVKIWKMAADFQNVCRSNVCLCSSVVLADVLEHNCNPAGENELSFVVGTCVFFSLHDSGIQRASAWATSGGKNVETDCWFPWRNVDAAATKQMKLSPSSPKKKKFSESSDKTSSTAES